MKIVMTGATGFVGRHTADYLASKGIEVVGLGRNKELGNNLTQSGHRFEAISLSDCEKLNRILEGADAVVHSAALSNLWGKYNDFYEANVQGTQNIINATLKNGIKRFVHISTPSIYVEERDKLNVLENDPLPTTMINTYAHTKLMAEKIVASTDGIDYIMLRPQGIFGEGEVAILPRLLRLAKKGMIPVIGSGENIIDMTHVKNVAHSIYLSLTTGRENTGEIYNVTNDEPIKNYEMLFHLCDKLNAKVKKKNLSFNKMLLIAGGLERIGRMSAYKWEPPLTRYSVCALSLSRTLDISNIKNRLGYKPLVSMEEGMAEYIEWGKKLWNEN